MTIVGLVGRLAAGGAWFSVEGERVRYHGPQRLLTDALRVFVEARREDLVAFLRKTEDEMTIAEKEALGYRRTLTDEELEGIHADRDLDDTDDVREMLDAFTSAGIDLCLRGDVIRCRIPRWEGWERVADTLRDWRQEIREELIRSPAAGRMKEGSFPTDIKSTVEVTV